MSQPISLYGFASQPVYTSTGAATVPAGQKNSFLLFSKNSKSNGHRSLDVSCVRDLSGKEGCAAIRKMRVRTLSAPIDHAISYSPRVWLPVYKSSSDMVQPCNLELLGKS